MKNCFLCMVSIVLLGFSIRNGDGQLIPGEIRYIVRVLNYSDVDYTGESYSKDVKFTLRNMQQYGSGKASIRRTFVIRKIVFYFERCRDLEIACEDFQTWNASGKDMCLSMNMKNQGWSPLVDAMDLKRFPQTCPLVEKGTYEVKNYLFDVNWVMVFYSDAIKYYWKIHAFVYNENNEIEYQCHLHVQIITYIKRRRTSWFQRS